MEDDNVSVSQSTEIAKSGERIPPIRESIIEVSKNLRPFKGVVAQT